MKNKNTYLLFAFITIGTLLSTNSCNKDKNCHEYNVSSSTKTSHNGGQECISCHTNSGKGEGCFNIAGTVYRENGAPVNQGNIKLYTLPNGQGTLKAKVNIDQSGNFYTTESVDVQGLYPVVYGENGMVQYMSSPITNGACNSCHGVSTTKIFIK